MTENKKALITGATGKVGQAVCLELAGAGFDIGIHYNLSEQRAWELAGRVEEAGGQTAVLKADLASFDECEDLEERTYNDLGHIDLFVHCASVFPQMPIGRVMPDDWDEMMAINLRSAFFLSQSIGLKMKEVKRDGRIVHFSDIAAARPYADYIPYCMSKAAIESMVKGLALDLAPEVKVNAIAPYLVRAEGSLNDEDNKLLKKVPLQRTTTPQEIARLITLLATASASMTGQTIAIDGGRSLAW